MHSAFTSSAFSSSALLPSPVADKAAAPIPEEPPLTQTEVQSAMSRIYERGDRIVGRFLLLHVLVALALAFFYETWLVTILVSLCAVAMFFISAAMLPRSMITRYLAGISLQAFVALHICQLHGMAEMHFFFFTGCTVMIVYQDWKCFWPGALAIITQHTVFALLHNSGVNMYFFEQRYVGVLRLFFHFGIVLVQVGICAYWAHLLQRQTLHQAEQRRNLQNSNRRLREEIVERQAAVEAQRAAEEHYRRVADNVPGAVYQVVRERDGNYRFRFMSEGCLDIFGVQPHHVLADSKAITSRIHPEDLPSMNAAVEASARYLDPLRWEGRVVLGEDWIKWIQFSSRPALAADGTIIWDGVVVDVSEMRKAAAEARTAKEEAERANLAKSEFLSRMSHELRTPLNAILGFGQLLQRSGLPPKQAGNVDFILTGGRHLLNLVNEVLDISRIETGKLTLSIEAVFTESLIEEVLSLMRPLADQRQITLHAPAAGTSAHYVLGDLHRSKQVLLNLLSNAIKYNRDGGEVAILCTQLPARPDQLQESRHGCLRIAVKDTGDGISSEHLERLFTPFDRLGAETRAIEGTGIGLALSKRLVEAMGGQIGVVSVRNEGSTFYIDLPLTEAPLKHRKAAALDSPAVGESPSLPRRTVLHIEDNFANREVVECVLSERPQIELITATQGRTGLELARAHLPDLILLDAHLPDLPGAEVLVRLQAEPATRKIPVILLSADATPRQIQRLRNLGATEYLTKPFEIDALLEALDRILKSVEAPIASGTTVA